MSPRPILLACVVFAAPGLVRAQGVITTVAGTDWIFPGKALPAMQAPIGLPTGLAIDPASGGSTILLDYLNHMAFRLGADGRLTPLAGNGLGGYSGDGGAAVNGSLLYPKSCTLDRDGNLYISDSEGRAIRRVSRDGVISTIAGLGRKTPADGLHVSEALFSSIISITALPAGELVVADEAQGRMFRISANGILTRLAGNGPCRSEGDGGPARAANICFPDHLASDSAGNVYFSDVVNQQATPRTRRIRRISPEGQMEAFAGNSSTGRIKDGAKALDSPMQPYALTTDARGGLLISSSIAAVQPTDDITDIARVNADGTLTIIPTPTLARVLLTELAATADGTLYATSSLPGRIYRITPTNGGEQIGGSGSFRFGGDGGPASFALLNLPLGLALDEAGNIFLADVGNHRVRKLESATGTITTVAGNGERLISPPEPGTKATANPLLQPFMVAMDPGGRPVFSSSFGLHRLDEDGGQAVEPYAAVNPGGLAFDAAGSLFYTDRGRGRLLRARGAPGGGPGFELSPVIPGDMRDTALATPFDLAADRAGNLYVSELANHRVLKIDAAGAVTTFAGTGRSSGAPIPAGVRPATSVAVTQPSGLAVDGEGNLIIRSYGHVSRVTPDGQLQVIAGIGPSNLGSVVFGDGGLATQAALGATGDVAVDAAGNVFLSETDNHRVRKILSLPPGFQVSLDKVELAAASGGAPSAVRTLMASGSIPGVAFAVKARTLSGGDWLRLSSTAAVTPRALQVSADPAQLAPGVYEGEIEFSAPLARPTVLTTAVRLQVGAAKPADLQVDKNSLTFTYPKTAAARELNLLVSNAGSGAAPIAVSVPAGSFLRATPSEANVTPAQPVQIAVTADPGQRAPGLYRSSVTVRSSAGAAKQVTVTMMISDREQAILLTQTGISFQAVAQGGIVPPQSFGIVNPGNGVMPWRVRTSTLAGGTEWLQVATQAGATDAAAGQRVPTVEVRINQSSLTPGVYHGLVEVESAEAANSPQVLPVMLEVLPAEARPPHVVQPAELTFRGVVGQPIGSQELAVFNLSGTPVAYRSSASLLAVNQPLQYAPTDAIVDPSEPHRLVLQPQAQLLPSGAHRSELSLEFADGSVHRVDVNVLLQTADSKDGARSADGCTAKRLIPAVRALGQAASVPAGWPAAVSVEVSDDCGVALADGSVVLSFSNGDPPLPLQSLKDGKWQGTWISRSAQAGAVTVRVTAEHPQLALRGEVESLADLRAADPPPALNEEGVINAPLAPGGLLTLSGEGFTANQVFSAPAGQALPDKLGETEVLIAGRRAPLFSAAAGRIQALVPLSVNPNTRQQLLVRRGATYSRAVPVNVAAAQPAIVMSADNGAPVAHVQRPGAAPLLITVQTPARAGDRVVLSCTGLGRVNDSTFAAGSQAPEPAAKTIAAITVRVGGVAVVEGVEATLVPGQIGQYQVAFTLPASAVNGDKVSVSVETFGQSSTEIALSVQ